MPKFDCKIGEWKILLITDFQFTSLCTLFPVKKHMRQFVFFWQHNQCRKKCPWQTVVINKEVSDDVWSHFASNTLCLCINKKDNGLLRYWNSTLVIVFMCKMCREILHVSYSDIKIDTVRPNLKSMDKC